MRRTVLALVGVWNWRIILLQYRYVCHINLRSPNTLEHHS